MRRRGVEQHDDFDEYSDYDEYGYDEYGEGGYDGGGPEDDLGHGQRHGPGRHERDNRVPGRHEGGRGENPPHGRHERHVDEHGRHERPGARGAGTHGAQSAHGAYDYDEYDDDYYDGDEAGYDEAGYDEVGHDEAGHDEAGYGEAGHGEYDDQGDDVHGLFGDETAPISRGRRTQERNRREVERRRRRAGPKLVAMIVVVAALLGIGIYSVGKVVGRIGGGGESTADYPGPGTGEAEVQIVEGATIRDIAKVLASFDVVASEGAFVAVAAANPDATGIQPGYYRMQTQMRAEDALTTLLDPGENALSRFTIPEGWTVQQIITSLSERTRVAVSEYQVLIDNPVDIGLPSWAPVVDGRPTVEGFLFPSTYDLLPGELPAVTLKRFVDKFKAEIATLDFESAAARGNMSPAEVLVVASVIEKEVADAEDGPQVARVVYNRLNDETGAFTRIDMDSTTRYALGLAVDEPLTQAHLDNPHPYNTRAVAGLPPGAISNPGLWALRSALQPAQGTWLYFVSLPRSDDTIFATTDAEWADALRRYREEGGG